MASRSSACALAASKPDVVLINTWPDTHAEYAIKALKAGAHVFMEKPIATTVADAERVIATAGERLRKLVVGYILRHHPSWEFVRKDELIDMADEPDRQAP